MITSNSLFKASHVLESLCCSPNKVQLTLYRFLLSCYLSSPSLRSSPLLSPSPTGRADSAEGHCWNW